MAADGAYGWGCPFNTAADNCDPRPGAPFDSGLEALQVRQYVLTRPAAGFPARQSSPGCGSKDRPLLQNALHRCRRIGEVRDAIVHRPGILVGDHDPNRKTGRHSAAHDAGSKPPGRRCAE